MLVKLNGIYCMFGYNVIGIECYYFLMFALCVKFDILRAFWFRPKNLYDSERLATNQMTA